MSVVIRSIAPPALAATESAMRQSRDRLMTAAASRANC
jgi:hypothetical protein